MTQHLINFNTRLKQQMIYIILFGAILTIFGDCIPTIYYKYFDTTQYYKISVPVKVGKTIYKAGDDVDIFVHRNSLISTQGKVTVSLTLVRQIDGLKQRVNTFNRNILIGQGEETYVTEYPIPVGVKEGMYFFEGDVVYTVRDMQKNTHFVTQVFQVIK